eukprot:tig00000144_g9025.t1
MSADENAEREANSAGADEAILKIIAASTHFETLALQPGCTTDEIKKNYRRLALLVHPDKNDSKEAEEAFKKLQSAFEVLFDEDRRADYGDSLNKSESTETTDRPKKTSEPWYHRRSSTEVFAEMRRVEEEIMNEIKKKRRNQERDRERKKAKVEKKEAKRREERMADFLERAETVEGNAASWQNFMKKRK